VDESLVQPHKSILKSQLIGGGQAKGFKLISSMSTGEDIEALNKLTEF